MRKNLVKKGLVLGIIILFVGASVVPCIGGTIENMGSKEYAKPKSTLNRGTIYVDDDADPSWYDATHVKTIKEGINNATEKDTVSVYNGTYYENVVIDKEGLILKSAGEDMFGNDSEGSIIDGQEIENYVIDIDSNNITINHFTIQNSSIKSDVPGIRISGTGGHNIINNFFTDNSRGIYCTDSSDLIIDNNIIFNTRNRGIYCRNSNKITISNNIIDDTGNDTIYCTNSDIITIENNILSNTGHHGVNIFNNCIDIKILNNIVSNYIFGIVIEKEVTAEVYNNTVMFGKNGILLQTSSAIVTYNQIYNNELSGIWLFDIQFPTHIVKIKRNIISDNKFNIAAKNSIIEKKNCRENNIINETEYAVIGYETSNLYLQHNYWGNKDNYWDLPDFKNYWQARFPYLPGLIILFPWSDHEWDCDPN